MCSSSCRSCLRAASYLPQNRSEASKREHRSRTLAPLVECKHFCLDKGLSFPSFFVTGTMKKQYCKTLWKHLWSIIKSWVSMLSIWEKYNSSSSLFELCSYNFTNLLHLKTHIFLYVFGFRLHWDDGFVLQKPPFWRCSSKWIHLKTLFSHSTVDCEKKSWKIRKLQHNTFIGMCQLRSIHLHSVAKDTCYFVLSSYFSHITLHSQQAFIVFYAFAVRRFKHFMKFKCERETFEKATLYGERFETKALFLNAFGLM